MFFNTKILLASKSSSRKTMFKNIKIKFIQKPHLCNEEKIKKNQKRKKTHPSKTSLIIAKCKAKSLSDKNKNILIVGSDTVVELDGKIINKAKNIKDAKKKIQLLSGREHNIYSSAAAYYNNKLIWRKTQKTIVKIRKLSKKDTNKYLKNFKKSILSSAGSYQIESSGPTIIENIKGDFFNVMGFPLFPFLLFLKKFNMKK